MTTRSMPQPGKLVVRGYGPETTDDEIRTWFEPFGPLEEVASPPDPVTKQSRGFTFVRFVNPADAERALKEMQKDVNKMKNGFTIRVEQSLYARGMGPTAQLRVAMSERRNDDDRGRYDRTERYAYGSRRPRSRSPPYRRGYDDYYPRDRYGDDYGHRYYEDYYRERYPVPPPRRDYYDRYEDRYIAPPRRDDYYSRDYAARDYYDEYPSDYYGGYDRGRRPPSDTRDRGVAYAGVPSERRGDSYAEDRYDGQSSSRGLVSSGADPMVRDTAASQPLTYPMPTNYRM